MCHVPHVEINTFITVTTVHGMNLFPACAPVVICVCSRADRKVICISHTSVCKDTTHNCTLVGCGNLDCSFVFSRSEHASRVHLFAGAALPS